MKVTAGNFSEVRSVALIHGWGGDSRSWQPLLDRLLDSLQGFSGEVVNLDLPGFGARTQEAWPDTKTLLAQLDQQLPQDCLLIGWSLGGMLAVRLAAASKKVRALVTIAANASFVARDDWPGMDADIFADFCCAQREQPVKNWQRFCGLEARGDSEMRGLLKTLKSWQPASIPDRWSCALDCLGSLDNRDLMSSIDVPALHIFGEGDALVPVAAAHRLAEAGSGVAVISEAGHCPHLSRPAEMADRIERFIEPLNPARSSEQPAPLDKSSVARAFGRAAHSYDAAAHLQRAVCRELLSRDLLGLEGSNDTQVHWSPKRILDLGSGTGYGSELLRKRFPDAEIIALDLAPQMLAYARDWRPRADAYIAGDAEQLPLADGCFDLVYSSFALQWCYRLPQLFGEIRRVMKPGARALISTLAPGTLGELESSWAAVDSAVHVNHFLPAEAWQQACARNQLDCALQIEQRVLHFDSVKLLMRELKSIGAHNVNREAGKGLLSRDRLRRMTAAYERQRTAAGLPATYEVVYLGLSRSPRLAENSPGNPTANSGKGATLEQAESTRPAETAPANVCEQRARTGSGPTACPQPLAR